MIPNRLPPMLQRDSMDSYIVGVGVSNAIGAIRGKVLHRTRISGTVESESRISGKTTTATMAGAVEA